MKTRFHSIFNVLALFALLVLLFGTGSISDVKAERLEKPFGVSGDFLWAKNMGGVDSFIGFDYDIAVDGGGNVYITGTFAGTVDFDPGPGVFNLKSVGTNYSDIFVSKLDGNGNFVWAKRLGDWDYDEGHGVAVDSSGNVYLTGSYAGDVFISKLNKNGNLVWIKFAGEAGSYDNGQDITVDSSGDVYITGYFWNGVGDYNDDIFVSKLAGINGDFIWFKSIGGPDSEDSTSIALGANGDVYTTGSFNGTADFDPGPDIFNLTSVGAWDAFISKLSNDGNFVWAKSMGGTGVEGLGIALDENNNVYSTGKFESTADFDPGSGTFNLTSVGGFDIFISKLDVDGNFVWAKSMGGVDDDWSNGIAVDKYSNVYTAGYYYYTVDFDPGPGTYELTGIGYFADVFVSKLNQSGGFVWAKSMGGASFDGGFDIEVDAGGNAYTVGSFSDTADFDPGSGLFELTSLGFQDVFVSKLEGNGSPTFGDVPFDHPIHDYIEALYDAGYTAGCSTSPMMYCPDTILDRAQSAVFMLRGQIGSGYTPPAAPWTTFGDDWTGFEWAEPWAEGMYQEGLTQGCQSSPLMYCPATQLPRVEASVFGLRMKYGVNYTPPAASGTLFADFPSTDPSYWAIDWAEQAYLDGLLPACGTDSGTGKPMFCPSQLVDRGWGAYLIVKAKNLPLP